MSEQDLPELSFDAASFRIVHTFFSQAHFDRTGSSPKERDTFPLIIEIGFEFSDEDKNYRSRLQVRCADEAEVPLRFHLVIEAIFEHVADSKPDEEELVAFVNQNLLVVLVAQIRQFVATVTSQMGIPPIWLPLPRGFGFNTEIIRQLAALQSK